MGGWSFTASGLAKDAGVIRRIGDEVGQVLQVPDAGTDSQVVSATHNGWGIDASGTTEDPGTHTWLANELGRIISATDALTGHSTFTSAHEQRTNFHAPAPPAGAAPPVTAAVPTPGAPATGSESTPG